MSAVNMQALNWAINAAVGEAERGLVPTYPPVVPQHTILLNVPLFHVTGTHVIFLPCFMAGRKLVMMCVGARWGRRATCKALFANG
jgi:hypothetical protein